MIDFQASRWKFQDGVEKDIEQLSVIECFQVIHALKMLVHKNPQLLTPVYSSVLWRAVTNRCKGLLNRLTDDRGLTQGQVIECVFGCG